MQAPSPTNVLPHTNIHMHIEGDSIQHPPSGQGMPSEDPVQKGQDNTGDSDADPAEQIESFDWEALREQYHQAVNAASEEEAQLLQEWAQLMEYFKIWAAAGHQHETDRTFSRFCTRMAYVDHAEHKLEKTRNHYIEVVHAFESALALLRAPGFARLN